MTPSRQAGRRIGRAYGPLVLAALAFLAMAVAVEPTDRPLEAFAGSAVVPNPGGPSDPATGVGEDPGGPRDPDAGDPDDSGGAGGPTGEDTSTGAEGDPTGVRACPDRAQQVPGDPYSPPCYAFAGDNGGATAKGVTADEIVVAVRQLEGPSAAEIFSDISGQNVSDSPEARRNTVLALAEYFSQRFNFYGRELRIEFFRGQGSGASELLGGGKEAALADATRSAQEIGAFADISGITIPYADALARHGVVNVGAPYPSRDWYVERRPYAWSLFPDGTRVVEAMVSWALARIADTPTAEFGGPGTRGKPRRIANIAPENAEYQGSVNAALQGLAEGGIPVQLNLKYKLDISSMPNQASNIVAQLKDAGITTVVCACDPVMLALGLTPKANEQNYHPEWVTAGLAFVEQDIVGQLIERGQWSRAFGIAFNAESEPMGRSFPYAAFKQVRPDDEPAFGIEELYYQMYILALGIHMAGPNLTPETFEAGLFAYPGGVGPRGTWRFGPGDYTPMDDFREIWWDADRLSAQNNRPGTWVQLNGGRRYLPGQVPRARAPYFQEG